MRISLRGLGRRRTVISVVGSVAAHLLVLGVLVWVKPPSMVVDVKRGEPLFVELPAADEPAQRGLPPASTPERPKAQPAPRPVAPAASPAPVTPSPSMVARAVPEPAPPTPVPPEAAAPRVAPLAPAPPAPREAAPDIRAALRRGAPGPGGAGGSGEGRAGIEGEPIPLDSKDPRYNDYLDRVRRMIKEKWAYPCVKNDATGHCEYKSAQLVIEFGILKDGRVPFVVVRKHSDFDIYDEYALNAIKLASPFPPVPDALTSGRKGIPILATFSYIVESSLTNLLR